MVNITAPDVVLATGVIVDASGRGLINGGGVGSSGAGGSFGGSGGQATCGDSSIPYYAADAVVGTVDVCDSLLVGSGGGNGGGRGGGGVWITGESVTIGGGILADGAASNNTSFGSGSGGSVCVKADSILVLGMISAQGGGSSETNSGAGGGGRVTLKYCDLYMTEFSHVDCHGGIGSSGCVNGGAGTRYDRQQCDGEDGDDDDAIHAVYILNKNVATQAMTLLDDKATLPDDVVLAELLISDSAIVGTRQLTVHSSDDSSVLTLSDGSLIVSAPDDITGFWSSDDSSTISLVVDSLTIDASSIVADELLVTANANVALNDVSSITVDRLSMDASDDIELNDASSIEFTELASIIASGSIWITVRFSIRASIHISL